MQKYIAVVLLTAGMLVAGTAINPTASAQAKKDKGSKVESKGVGYIEIGKGKDSKYRFTVHNADGKFLALSGPFATEKEIRDAIEAFRKVVATAKVTTKKDAKPKD
jgi:uncharacterized protein YegP (UPF0339 family)